MPPGRQCQPDRDRPKFLLGKGWLSARGLFAIAGLACPSCPGARAVGSGLVFESPRGSCFPLVSCSVPELCLDAQLGPSLWPVGLCHRWQQHPFLRTVMASLVQKGVLLDVFPLRPALYGEARLASSVAQCKSRWEGFMPGSEEY